MDLWLIIFVIWVAICVIVSAMCNIGEFVQEPPLSDAEKRWRDNLKATLDKEPTPW